MKNPWEEPDIQYLLEEAKLMQQDRRLKDFYFGTFVISDKSEALYKNLERYYVVSESMNPLQASREYRMFRDWAIDCGYTQADINRAKSMVGRCNEDRFRLG